MPLFKFVREAGEKILKVDMTPPTTTAEAARHFINQQKITILKSVLAKHQLHITDLELLFEGDTVVISGVAANQAEREKAVLAIGNVDGIGEVDDRLTLATEPEEESKFHTVKKGEYLSLIAKQYYGDAMKYPVIFEANRPMLTDPNLIYPGQVLRIPALGKA
jgi:nucleoid-associated protein YgaU